MSAELALQQLLNGNKRFITDKSLHPNQDIKRRSELKKGQNPVALILSCYDSRITPEIIFDQGLGDLFILRTAGNVLNTHIIGSIEYAVKYLQIPLVMVLGHEDCAAIDFAMKNINTDSNIDDVVNTIRQNIGQIDMDQENFLDIAAKKNVQVVIDQLKSLSPIIFRLINAKQLKIVGGYYNLKSGKVDIIPELEKVNAYN